MNTPVHNLTVSERVKDSSRSGAAADARMSSESVSDDESTADEFEDASDVVMDDMFPDTIRGSTPQRSRPLSTLLSFTLKELGCTYQTKILTLNSARRIGR